MRDHEGVRSALAFRRSGHDRVVAGVAGGFAAANGVDPFLVRAALAVLALAGGVGGMIYLILLAISTAPEPDQQGSFVTTVSPTATPPDRNLAFGFVAAGVLFGCRAVGLWSGDAVMIPLSAAGLGLAIIGVAGDSGGGHSGGAGRGLRSDPWGPIPASRLTAALTGRWAPLRIGLGGLLIIVGIFSVGPLAGVLGGIRIGLIGALAASLGLAVVLAPWLGRHLQQLSDERRSRIRSEERAAMAAHLHDSVLQTLALIQRGAEDPRRTVTLARRQERELRAWLYGGKTAEGPVRLEESGLAEGVTSLVGEVEERHGVVVDQVVVGDHPPGPAVAAILGAAREAVVNAAKHAGTDAVSLYVEVDGAQISAFVRDRGGGFDPAGVPADRQGLARSVRARIERAGGEVEIESTLGVGTEVRMSVPTRIHDREPPT